MKKYILKHKLLLFLSIAAVILISITEAYQAILFQIVIDTATGTYKLEFINLFLYVMIFLLAVFTSETFSKASNSALNASVMRDYKQSIIKSFLDNNNQSRLSSSELISILNNDVTIIENSYLKSLINMTKDIFLFIVSLFLLFRIKISLTLAILVLSWLPVVVPQLFTKKNQLLKERYLGKAETFVNQIKEIAQGFEVIKGFNLEKNILNKFSKINKEVEQSKFKADAFTGFQGAISVTSGFLMFFINLLIASYFVIQGDITLGQMMAAVQLMNYIVNPLISISRYLTEIRAATRIISTINEKILHSEAKSSQGTKEFIFDKNLRITGLRYSYDNREDVISDINYIFEKGKKYAIVGESGCGKSTLLKILMNQIYDYQGQISIDDNDIKSFDAKSYYSKVALIQQNVFVFKDTLKNNICLYNEFSDEKINDTIMKSGLTKTMRMHNAGLDTLIGEGHVELSGGELNRVSIARALIKDVEILLVDEATSALDKVMAYDIEKTILGLDSTVIAITHRIDENILRSYDEILVMKDGKIVESGDFQKLIANKEYFYYMYSKNNSNTEDINNLIEFN
ncbi:MAG TPA: ABC transporter ATP-binding protein [Soehngenia sp.]|nr:ABC transporter ATP-binding protein [Soehngenia sp.]